MVSLSALNSPPVSAVDGLRPVNLKTDLAPLANLIEMAFSASMDSGGRAAIREMRALSHVGAGLSVLASMNDMMQGIGLGYVWVEGGDLVGNVSIYPANLPRGEAPTWIIANVAVHPDHRGHGIARRLMSASLDVIARRAAKAGSSVILQVEADNQPAYHLYQSMGFRDEGTWTHWRRSGTARIPFLPERNPAPYIARRRRSEWRDEYALAQRVRGGQLGWLRPLKPALFHRSLGTILSDGFNLRSVEHLVIRAPEGGLGAVMWIESAFAAGSVHLTLLVDPRFAGTYDEALLAGAARRFSGRTLAIEHPDDDMSAHDLLKRYHFTVQRRLIHMRYSF